MEYRIEHLDLHIKLIGRGTQVQTSKAFQAIPAIWNTATKDGFVRKLVNLSWEKPKCKLEGLLGVCGKEAVILDDEFSYFMGVRYDGEVPSDMESLIISHRTWAVFPDITTAWKGLYTEWVPSSGYELANVPCIECYYPPERQPSNELWVPVIDK
ncbi:GyrI-like domain-containing protein [Cytobacillus gottheilii]|uniref:GyrI-like domain-containing protein n=1 Tax=Cytobacillus gottheilii TaxID=859144 RepID=A0ABX8FEQ7_9BACI|nr:GyrI-like domain-containing protein [Cytobacillus gottheilii]QVY62487.1 GyrI-like domain-containing protein [Cytobacillus gottheilii]